MKAALLTVLMCFMYMGFLAITACQKENSSDSQTSTPEKGDDREGIQEVKIVYCMS